jgi:hypothetical protein
MGGKWGKVKKKGDLEGGKKSKGKWKNGKTGNGEEVFFNHRFNHRGLRGHRE